MSITLDRHSNLRSWTYTVHLSEVDGRVLRVTAGCRSWKTFAEAQAHYEGGGPYTPNKWTDMHINSLSDYMKFELRAFRWEARKILRRLECAAEDRSYRILEQRKRERIRKRKRK
jgi:hypothetical protein